MMLNLFSALRILTVSVAMVASASSFANPKQDAQSAGTKLETSGAHAPAPAGMRKMTLGILGQTVENTKIFSSPSTRSRVYYRLKPYEYIVINTSRSSNYFSVLLQNGMQGFIPRAAVAKLPYDVTINVPANQARGLGTESGRAAAASRGTQFTGTPYKWGGNDPLNGIDCSAFVKFLYGEIGINLPRTAAEQARVGAPITRLEDLQKGDRLYFWDKSRGKIGHTGIYMGNGYFVHSSSSRKGVATDYLGNPKWRNILVAARR